MVIIGSVTMFLVGYLYTQSMAGRFDKKLWIVEMILVSYYVIKTMFGTK